MKYLSYILLFVLLTPCVHSNAQESKFKPEKVADGIYRGVRPNSFADLYNFKIKYVINLQSGVYETFSSNPYEKEKAEDFGKIELEKKWGDVHAPTIEELKEVAKEIDEYSKKGGVYIHCLHGRDRTGMAIAAWRILYDGWTVEQAIDEMNTHGFHTFPYFYWKKQLYNTKT